MDSYAIVRNSREKSCVPLPQFPPRITSCKIIVQYRNRRLTLAQSRMFPPQKELSCGPLIATPTTFRSVLNSWQPLIGSPSPLFCVSRKLCNWNHTVCNLSRLAFSAEHSSLESSRSLRVSLVHLCSSSPTEGQLGFPAWAPWCVGKVMIWD